MKLSDILRDIEVIETNIDPETEIAGLCYDSRAAEKGSLFVAIRGYESDGHRYIPSAFSKGATAVLCETAPEDGAFVRVADTRRALALASRNFFGDPASEMKLIGLTGTNGKTTSSYLLKHLLEAKLDAKVGLIGTNGNMIGDEFLPSERTTPESYELQRLFREMADAGCTHVVMEVSSHSLVLSRVAGIEYDTALFTNLTQDHLDFHGTMENYAAAKALLFAQSKTGWVNSDDPWAGYMENAAHCPMQSFAVNDTEAGLRAENVRLASDGVSFTAVCAEEHAAVHLSIPGLFSVYNALGVIAAGLSLGVSLADCADALSSAKGVKGRVEVVPTDGDYTVLIDYAHTPDALENVLKTLRPVTKGRLFVVFGCGGDRDRKKRPIMGRIAGENADVCVVTSDNPRTEKPQDIIDEIMTGVNGETCELKMICDRVEAIRWALDNVRSNDVILLAGKGHEDYQEINHVKYHMDEREIVAEYTAHRG